MKGTKKLLSILMVLTLVLSLSAGALAAEGTDQVTVTLPGGYKDHTMVAYKIFDGAQAKDASGQGELGVTGWAAGVDSGNLLKALAEKYTDAGFEEGMDAPAAAKAINGLGLSGAKAYEFATIVAEHVSGEGVTFSTPAEGQPSASLSSGYWIIVDKTPSASQPTGFAYSAYLLQVVGDEGQIPVTPKFDAPSVDKQVADQNDSKTDQQSWGEVADWDIGDDVPFRLEATMPSTLEGYTSYKLVFHDTLSKGLTFNENSVKVAVGGKEITKEGNWTVESSSIEGGTTITVTIGNVLAEAIGAGINSKITVTYDAKLGTDAVIGDPGNPNEVYLEYSNNPNGEGTGKTPTHKVVVFTFQLDVDKVKPAPTDDDPNATEALAGAGFTLYKYDADAEGEDKWVAVGTEVQATQTGEKFTASFKGLDEGKYKLVETTVPAGFNKADDIEFEVTADETADGVTSLTIKDGAGETISGEGKTFTVTPASGLIDTDVVNSAGLELPETGGIGTTIFYVAGAVLVAAAAVLLVTKKRVNGAEK